MVQPALRTCSRFTGGFILINPTPTGTASPDLSVDPDSPSCRCATAREALDRLIDERRELAAKVAGKDMEIALLLGERDTAKRALVEMLAQIEARRAVREACYFDEQGERDAAAMKGANV